jgi:uncharacterized membrane protein (DUF4010 family)
MEQLELFQRLGVALAVGLLVGLERGWRTRDDADTDRTAGLRTYGLSGLLGGISAALGVLTDPLVLAAAMLAYTAAVGAFFYREAREERNFSATGLVAALLTFAVGAYAVVGTPAVAIATAVAMTIVLALREQLHGIVRNVTWLELRAVLTLMAMTFLLLPVLPDRAIDPWDSLNPYDTWLLAILIAAVSFIGYVLVRVTGDSVGIGLASLTGGLSSSTATTLALARMQRESSGAARVLAGGVLMAGSIMMFRVVVIVFLLLPALAGRIAPAVAGAGVICLVAGALMTFRSNGSNERPDFGLKNPFELKTALKLAALIAVIGLVANIVVLQVGNSGVFAVAALSGLADVDAVTLSFARMADGHLAFDAAALGIVIAVASNTIAKTAMAVWLGDRSFGALVGVVNAAAIAAMLAIYWLMPSAAGLFGELSIQE